MRFVFSLILFFFFHIGHTQSIHGIVIDEANKKPLAGVAVYIENSSRSTQTDANGAYTIEGFSNSSYELIFSSVGYEILSIGSNRIKQKDLHVELKPKENMLDPVVIQSYEKDGWNKWGKLFTENFIGILPFSNQCTIKNKDVVKFKFSKKKNQLEVIALEPLIIINDYLGYRIRYDLKYFVNDFSTHYIFYGGYTSFSNISNGKHYLKVREKRRSDVYTSSMLHFMRSMYRNDLENEGFQIRTMKKIPNWEKFRADSIYKANTYISINPDGSKAIMTKMEQVFPRDSINYYKYLRKQPDILSILDNHFITAQDLLVRKDAVGNVYRIPDYLYITYPNKLEIPNYYTNNININGDSCVTAVISCSHDSKEITIFENGQFSPPTTITSELYWSWSEKISSMLPFDYKFKTYEK